MTRLNRREFIKRSLIAAAGIGLTSSLPRRAYSSTVGANDTIRVAIIGLGGDRIRYKQGKTFKALGGKGSHMIPEFNDPEKGGKVVALCDPDSYNLQRDLKQFEGVTPKVEGYADFRKILDRKDIDAVYIASCNHWHALQTVLACQAGKDVYVEKPVSHNIWEGRKMVEAARKYNRIVQGGTGMRSSEAIKKSIEYVRAGNLGKMKLIRAICFRDRPSIGKVSGPQQPPPTVDYDLWTGPAEMQPVMRESFHYDWHWIWNYGNGEVGDLGAHMLDIARWASGQNQAPKRVINIGGRKGYIDDGQTPNTEITFFDYDPVPILWENRGLYEKKGSTISDNYLGCRLNTIVHCENGYVVLGSWAYDKDGKKLQQFSQQGEGDHVTNFYQAMRSRKPSDLNAEILEGHLSCILSHMSNISHRIGKQATPDQIMESIKTQPDTAEAFERMKAHLAANEIDIAKDMLVLGPWLTFDATAERFTGTMAEQANELLTRKYRAPYTFPEKI